MVPGQKNIKFDIV